MGKGKGLILLCLTALLYSLDAAPPSKPIDPKETPSVVPVAGPGAAVIKNATLDDSKSTTEVRNETAPSASAPDPPTTKPTPPTTKPTEPAPTTKPTEPTTKPTEPAPTTKPTEPPATTTVTPPPAPTTPKPTPSSTSPAPSPTPKPSPTPDKHFDVPSFIGGIILALGLTAIGYVVFKFYKSRTDPNYRSL